MATKSVYLLAIVVLLCRAGWHVDACGRRPLPPADDCMYAPKECLFPTYDWACMTEWNDICAASTARYLALQATYVACQAASSGGGQSTFSDFKKKKNMDMETGLRRMLLSTAESAPAHGVLSEVLHLTQLMKKAVDPCPCALNKIVSHCIMIDHN